MDSYLSAYCICISWSISLLTLGYGVLAAGYHVCGTTARFAQLGDRYIVYFHTCSAPDPRTQCCSPDSQYISSAWLVKNGTNQTSLSHNISYFWVGKYNKSVCYAIQYTYKRMRSVWVIMVTNVYRSQAFSWPLKSGWLCINMPIHVDLNCLLSQYLGVYWISEWQVSTANNGGCMDSIWESVIQCT